MTNAELLTKLKAEIERLYGDNHNHADRWDMGYDAACEKMLDFIDTLKSEKPIISGDNLESAIDSFWNTASGYQPKFVTLEVKKDGFEKIARHFYDLGCRRTSEKYDEIEYNRQRAGEHLATSGKTISVKPGDEVTINGHKIVYNKDNGYVTIVKSEESVPKDLEEAAVDIADALLDKPKDYVLSAKADYWNGAHDGIIAGAKWQAEHTPLPEDTVLFNKGVEEGKRLMMMDAVDAIVEDWNPDPEPEITIPLNPEEFTRGDKVRIIIVKED